MLTHFRVWAYFLGFPGEMHDSPPDRPARRHSRAGAGLERRRPLLRAALADFGAEVIKVEVAEGDAVRSMGKRLEASPLYAASIFRNKRLVSIDLKTPRGRELVAALAENPTSSWRTSVPARSSDSAWATRR
jgi:hypothetical protein